MSPPSDSRPTAVPDLEATLDALYQAPLSEFVGLRNAEVKRWRAIDRAVSDAVKARAKPSISAWAINTLWWRHRAAFDALLDVGEQLRQAAVGGDGPAEQARLGAERRRAVQALLQLAERELLDAGHAAASAVMRRVTTSLEACGAYGRALPEPGPGRLHGDLAPPGFGVLSTLGPLPDPRPAPRPVAELVATAPTEPVVSATTRRWTLELEQARTDERSRAMVLDEATRRADRLSEAGLDAQQAHDRARAQLSAAAAEEERTRLHAAELGARGASAERDRTLARAELAEVRRVVEDLKRKLEDA